MPEAKPILLVLPNADDGPLERPITWNPIKVPAPALKDVLRNSRLVSFFLRFDITRLLSIAEIYRKKHRIAAPPFLSSNFR
jgi:hypothetical protein